MTAKDRQDLELRILQEQATQTRINLDEVQRRIGIAREASETVVAIAEANKIVAAKREVAARLEATL